MPVRKTPPYKTLARNLLSSKKLTDSEQAAFEKMILAFEQGQELSDHQKLWIETLNQRYLAKS